jgi:hypothetical protein
VLRAMRQPIGSRLTKRRRAHSPGRAGFFGRRHDTDTCLSRTVAVSDKRDVNFRLADAVQQTGALATGA